MHEYKHGELKKGRGGAGGKVKSRKQAIAIALHESGQSKYESPKERRSSYAKSKRKEAHGETAQQEKEGESRVGARGRRESSKAMGGGNGRRKRRLSPTTRRKLSAAGRKGGKKTARRRS
jgi:hypothetical protein